MVDLHHPDLSLRRQCQLLGLNRATFYYQPAGESAENLALMRLIDQEYTQRPFYGYRKISLRLTVLVGYPVNHKRVAQLMRLMGLAAVAPGPRTSTPAPGHKVFPYLLKGITISRPNQVWSADITYVPVTGGFMYLVVVMDWYSRFVLAWLLSNTLDGAFCLEAVQQALLHGAPTIFNTDQGSQFTAHAFTDCLIAASCQVSMDGRGRAFDNIFIERFWRSVKYEDIYLNDYPTVPALAAGLERYFTFYNYERPHQSLAYATPAAVHFGC